MWMCKTNKPVLSQVGFLIFLGSLAYLVSCLWPHEKCQGWIPFHEVGLIQADSGWLFLQALCHCFTSILSKQDVVVDRSLYPAWCLPFFFCSMQSDCQYHEHQSIFVKALSYHYSASLCLMSFIRVGFSIRALPSIAWIC